MTVLLQASDPHFGTEQPVVVEALAQLVSAQRPDVLMLSGDITQRATRAQFDRAQAFIRRLRVPAVLAIPGNHDIPLFNLIARTFAPYKRYRRVFGHDLEPEFDGDDVLIIGVNTTRRYRHVDGAVSKAQITRVERRMQLARPEQWRAILVHQPVAVSREQDRHNLLHGHEAALQCWAAAGADLVLGGHIHLPYVLPLQELWPNLARPMWVVQAGTAISTRVRAGAGNSVNVIRIGSSVSQPRLCTDGLRACVVERWDYSTAGERFECVEASSLLSVMASPETQMSGRLSD